MLVRNRGMPLPRVQRYISLNSKIAKRFGNPQRDCLYGALQYLRFTRPYMYRVFLHVCLFIHDLKTHSTFSLKGVIHYVHGIIYLALHLYPSSIKNLISYIELDWNNMSNTQWSKVLNISLNISLIKNPLNTRLPWWIISILDIY